MAPERPSDDQLLRGLLVPDAGTAALPRDELYLRIWELEQGHTGARWANTTFFFSVSFAIFGFSFQVGLAEPLPLGARLIALSIYWFAYLLFRRFNRYTALLRGYLYELERSGQTSVTVQSRARAELRAAGSSRTSATRLLGYFGLLYSLSVPLLWWLAP
jgi:hypothetical protein